LLATRGGYDVKRGRIRIESHEDVVMNAKVVYLPPEEGAEPVDISRCLTGIDVHLHVGEVARATLHAIFVDGTLEAEVHGAMVKFDYPSRWDRLRFRLSRWWHARPKPAVQATAIGDSTKRHVPGLGERRR
jgi:hypothetical protein